MNSPRYESLFTADLGKNIVRHYFDGSDTGDYADLWPPILTEDGTWGCKVLTVKDTKSSVTVMPGDDSLSSLLRGIGFIYDVEKQRGHAVPHIKFIEQPE